MEKFRKMVGSDILYTGLAKLIRIMKLTSFIVFFAVAQVFAINTYSQATRLSLNMENVTVRDVLLEIEESSEFYFLYSNKLIDVERKIDVDFDNKKIEEVLDKVFMGESVKYYINDRQIILSPEGLELQRKGDFFMQPKKITGSVVSETGETLPGVTVVVRGTTVGTVTDMDGNFTLNVESDSQILVFSFVGMATQEIEIGERTEFSVVMRSATIDIGEVVAVGYGTMKKSDLTGSVASVKGDILTKRSTQQLSTAMQGQMSGVQITRSSGAPGASATVRIRGITTLSENDPLVIVDGVPSSLNDVVSADVETMTVLKDAASAAIYGSRAAAGVILITTKRAKKNQFSFDYNYEYAIDKPTAQPKNGDVIDWMNIQNEIKWNDGGSSVDPYSQYSQETINSWLSNNASDPYHYPNTNWVDLLLKKTTSHEQHTFSVTGGTEKLRTKSTFNYQKGDGYYKNKSYERFAGRINNDYEINDWLSANFDLDFSKSTAVSPSQINAIEWAYLIAPYYPAYWEDGRYADTKDGGNMLAALEKGGTNDINYYKFGGKAQLDITPLEGLKLTAIFAPRFAFTKGKKFTRAVPTYYEDGSVAYVQRHTSTNLAETRNDNNSLTYQFYGNYQKKLGDHSFSGMAGYEGYSYEWENLGASRTNYLLDTYPYLNIGPEDYQYNSGNAGHNAYQSVFGRLMYSFKNRYMLQGNVRSDGSSRFAKDYRWSTFYSMSAGWVMSEESWFQNNVVDYLKIRGSIGQLGNERIGSEFPYQASMNFGNSYMYDKSIEAVTAVQNAAQVYYAFENITWETTTTYGGGLDLKLLDNRLNFSGDYYYKETKDMLLTLGFPSYAGFSAPKQNAGDMNTRGWDVELAWYDRKGDFWYRISANLSDYRSKMGYLGDKRTVNGNKIYEEGSYFNEWFMYKTDGLFQTDADFYDENGNPYPTLTANDKVGNIKYIDTDDSKTINADDKVRLGNSLPEYLYGGNIAMGWKGIDFNLSFQGIGHQRVLFNTEWIQPLKQSWGAVPELVLGNYWSQHNTEEENLKAKYPRLTYTNTTNTYTGSDYWLFNGGYFRVKNITLGYTLPKSLLSNIRIKDMRCYFSVNDLPAISNYPKGWDPEVGSTSDFISTSFIFGVNVKF